MTNTVGHLLGAKNIIKVKVGVEDDLFLRIGLGRETAAVGSVDGCEASTLERLSEYRSVNYTREKEER